jgi:hypothetical protein
MERSLDAGAAPCTSIFTATAPNAVEFRSFVPCSGTRNTTATASGAPCYFWAARARHASLEYVSGIIRGCSARSLPREPAALEYVSGTIRGCSERSLPREPAALEYVSGTIRGCSARSLPCEPAPSPESNHCTSNMGWRTGRRATSLQSSTDAVLGVDPHIRIFLYQCFMSNTLHSG